MNQKGDGGFSHGSQIMPSIGGALVTCIIISRDSQELANHKHTEKTIHSQEMMAYQMLVKRFIATINLDNDAFLEDEEIEGDKVEQFDDKEDATTS